MFLKNQRMMRAVEISTYGSPDVLKISQRPVPEITDGQILIKVAAAGLNRADLLQRMGKYPPPEGASDLPGLEVSGIVAQSNHPDWPEGQRVCALLEGGGYAEYVAVAATQCFAVPDHMDLVQAAAFPEALLTVWNAVFHEKRGHLQPGETLLIHGGTSGIGVTAIQMAAQWGAKIVTTAGSDEKCQTCLDLGAYRAVNYKKQGFVEALQSTGIDVVLDMVGGDYVPRNLSLLNMEGRHVSIAHQTGSKAELPISLIMQKRLIVTGCTLRARAREDKASLTQSVQDHMWPHVAAGRIRPVISDIFPLEDVAKAHERMEQGGHIGKILLTL